MVRHSKLHPKEPASAHRNSVLYLASGYNPFIIVQIAHRHLSESEQYKDSKKGSAEPKTLDVIWAAPKEQDPIQAASAEDSMPAEFEARLKEKGISQNLIAWLKYCKNCIIYHELQMLLDQFPGQLNYRFFVYDDAFTLA